MYFLLNADMYFESSIPFIKQKFKLIFKFKGKKGTVNYCGQQIIIRKMNKTKRKKMTIFTSFLYLQDCSL